MPCYEAPRPEEILATKMPAVLCAIVRILGPDEIVDKLPWKEVGVSPAEFLAWWSNHEKYDTARRALQQKPGI